VSLSCEFNFWCVILTYGRVNGLIHQWMTPWWWRFSSRNICRVLHFLIQTVPVVHLLVFISASADSFKCYSVWMLNSLVHLRVFSLRRSMFEVYVHPSILRSKIKLNTEEGTRGDGYCAHDGLWRLFCFLCIVLGCYSLLRVVIFTLSVSSCAHVSVFVLPSHVCILVSYHNRITSTTSPSFCMPTFSASLTNLTTPCLSHMIAAATSAVEYWHLHSSDCRNTLIHSYTRSSWQRRLANVTCVWRWRLCEIIPAIRGFCPFVTTSTCPTILR
jgi:hypothetical protein